VSNQLTKVTRQLRSMILRGDLAQGERITESSLADRLGVSRTPVRLALAILEQEDLVEGAANRGFRVRRFTLDQVKDAIAVRSTLEGMAARLAAERGLSAPHRRTLERCNALIERLVEKANPTRKDLMVFTHANEVFHRTIADAAGSPSLTRLLEKDAPLPIRSSRFLFMLKPEQIACALGRSAREHVLITEAISNQEGTRAEFLMREHALIPLRLMDHLMHLFDQETGANVRNLPARVA